MNVKTMWFCVDNGNHTIKKNTILIYKNKKNSIFVIWKKNNK